MARLNFFTVLSLFFLNALTEQNRLTKTNLTFYKWASASSFLKLIFKLVMHWAVMTFCLRFAASFKIAPKSPAQRRLLNSIESFLWALWALREWWFWWRGRWCWWRWSSLNLATNYLIFIQVMKANETNEDPIDGYKPSLTKVPQRESKWKCITAGCNVSTVWSRHNSKPKSKEHLKKPLVVCSLQSLLARPSKSLSWWTIESKFIVRGLTLRAYATKKHPFVVSGALQPEHSDCWCDTQCSETLNSYHHTIELTESWIIISVCFS